MNINGAVKTRGSIRTFLPKRGSEETIKELFDDALWASSWRNTKQYEFAAAAENAASAVLPVGRQELAPTGL